MRARLMAAGLLALALAAGGCGVSAQREPQAIPTDRVPFGLLSPPASPPIVAVPAARQPRLFFVRDNRLVGVARTLPDTDPAALIRLLLEGPSAFEASHRVRTAISADTQLLSARRDGDVLTVDLSGQFVQLRGQEQILAIAQLVYTATSAPAVRAVVFRLNGSPLDVPEGDGTLVGRPVGRSDYRELAPPTTTTPAPASPSAARSGAARSSPTAAAAAGHTNAGATS